MIPEGFTPSGPPVGYLTTYERGAALQRHTFARGQIAEELPRHTARA